jgi:hypothetical protein
MRHNATTATMAGGIAIFAQRKLAATSAAAAANPTHNQQEDNPPSVSNATLGTATQDGIVHEPFTNDDAMAYEGGSFDHNSGGGDDSYLYDGYGYMEVGMDGGDSYHGYDTGMHMDYETDEAVDENGGVTPVSAT